ncbi:MAG TPA: hypothetical protein VEL74_20985 [Thermoanaerobaculia bacterium]|nr:hypothetical protein [Thermoanaerobaculia bacterium]
MSRRTLRRGAGALILAAGVLLPQASWGLDLQVPPGGRGALSALEWTGWSDLWSFFTGALPKNRGSIDPDGEPVPSGSTQAAPAPTAPDPASENRGGIDPDG